MEQAWEPVKSKVGPGSSEAGKRDNLHTRCRISKEENDKRAYHINFENYKRSRRNSQVG
jgi:hypothetical protein